MAKDDKRRQVEKIIEINGSQAAKSNGLTVGLRNKSLFKLCIFSPWGLKRDEGEIEGERV
jgi:hypothetical protein